MIERIGPVWLRIFGRHRSIRAPGFCFKFRAWVDRRSFWFGIRPGLRTRVSWLAGLHPNPFNAMGRAKFTVKALVANRTGKVTSREADCGCRLRGGWWHASYAMLGAEITSQHRTTFRADKPRKRLRSLWGLWCLRALRSALGFHSSQRLLQSQELLF